MFNKIKNFLFDSELGAVIILIVTIVCIAVLSGVTGEIYGL